MMEMSTRFGLIFPLKATLFPIKSQDFLDSGREKEQGHEQEHGGSWSPIHGSNSYPEFNSEHDGGKIERRSSVSIVEEEEEKTVKCETPIPQHIREEMGAKVMQKSSSQGEIHAKKPSRRRVASASSENDKKHSREAYKANYAVESLWFLRHGVSESTSIGDFMNLKNQGSHTSLLGCAQDGMRPVLPLDTVRASVKDEVDTLTKLNIHPALLDPDSTPRSTSAKDRVNRISFLLLENKRLETSTLNLVSHISSVSISIHRFPSGVPSSTVNTLSPHVFSSTTSCFSSTLYMLDTQKKKGKEGGIIMFVRIVT
jgi:hypothetical protein